ncbi:MAG: carnitine 3-dehydrogenase [Actinobacteria bacterium]|nr:carnitine 3-dehydrogenase [Actinomycetota bacterium]MBT3688099.1 carnitine 3-dehydrogenase [Actinomycetota bacterium]MBT4037680.1 carnitine 3-dehydrogenase [Actinomycetota bacterium]MBT4278094.1 carnitine 3-dehydrogenase [Actinomycetota bacterium]MBT4342540.1 carnitine 3-dehydrogenase [Actinomycetota bacterium]
MTNPLSSGRTIGVVGTGVIGAGWTVRALGRGHSVVAWDPDPAAEKRLREFIGRAWPSATRLGLFPGADPENITFAPSAAELAGTVDWIQENAPEREALKRDLINELAGAAPPDTVIASSSSGLLPSRLQQGCRHPERVVIGHPFNPVYLLPLVEVVAGEQTSQETVDAAVAHYDDLVMHPLVVDTEIEGYLSDRLQEAVWREILHLVKDGVATTAQLDDAITYGPGLRWAGMGTNLTFHLAGGEQGMRHMLQQFGPALELPWTKLVAPELTDDLVDAMADGCLEQADGRSIADLEALRDDYVINVMRALRPLDLGAGRLVAEREARIHSASAVDPWRSGEPVAAPLDLYRAPVEPDWVDYNGHMSEWAFLTAFGWASDKLFRYLGIDETYRGSGHSFFTVETHLNNLSEASLGDSLRITTQVLGFDEKRLHIFHSMRNDETGELLATTEQMLLHVDNAAGRTAPILAGPATALHSVAAAHSDLPVPSQVGRVMALG